MKLIDKDKIAAEIEKRRSKNSKNKLNLAASFEDNYLLSFLDTLETKEIDWDALAILAEHLIACEAHGVTPKYSDGEIDMLEKLRNNKVQKGELV